MQKLLSDSVYTTGLRPASSTPLLILWPALQPELLVVLQVAITTGVDLPAGSVCLAKECHLESSQTSKISYIRGNDWSLLVPPLQDSEGGEG